MALERVLLQLKTAEFGNSGEFSQVATSRPSDELIGSEAVCTTSIFRAVDTQG